jgi:ZIP family zinc transporter
MALDRIIPHLHLNSECPEGMVCNLSKPTMMFFAVALHNLPEGMAVGVVIAGWLSGNAVISLAGALTLSLGIAIQNLPEGAIVSMPLTSNGMSRKRAFAYGVISGAVEPIGAIITILLAKIFVPILPFLLAFSAGAMLYVVVEELIPEMSEGEHSHIGVLLFTVGFSLMMVLDVALG